jgi:hypothetical protein
MADPGAMDVSWFIKHLDTHLPVLVVVLFLAAADDYAHASCCPELVLCCAVCRMVAEEELEAVVLPVSV